MAISRTEARERVFELLFETDFRADETPEAIFAIAAEDRGAGEDPYIRETYFGTMAHRAEIDALISKNARGWKLTRISPVPRALLRLAVYEMLYVPDIPESVSLNEAVELCKKFGEEEARAFLNGVLNSVKNEILAARHEG